MTIFLHSPITRLRDFKAFKGITANRQTHFNRASSVLPQPPQGVNAQAKRLHPTTVDCVIDRIATDKYGNYIITLLAESGPFPLFSAGQYMNLPINGVLYPFFIMGRQAKAPLQGISVMPACIVSEEMTNTIKQWQIHKKLTVSSPIGYFYYMPLRDGEKVIFVCDNSGLGAGVLFACEENAPEKKVYCTDFADERYQNVLSIKESELDFSGADTVFVCGEKAFCERIIRKAQHKKIRRLYTDMPLCPVKERKQYTLTVIIGNETRHLSCQTDEPLINALERADIKTYRKCMSGDCSFCRARLVSGEVLPVYPDGTDTRREADIKYGFIHPCICYPLSDITLKY